MKKSQGFTLIELIAVIAILAILAATAIPQFVDLRLEARNAATAGVGGSISSAAAMNYAKKVAGQPRTVVNGAGACAAALGLVTGVAGYTIVDGAAPLPSDGVAGNCALTDPTGATTITIQVVGAS